MDLPSCCICNVLSGENATHGLRPGLWYAPRRQLRARLEVLFIAGPGTKVLSCMAYHPAEAGGEVGVVAAAVS